MPRREYTPEQRKQYRETQRAEAAEVFAKAVETLSTSEGFNRWIQARAAFHDYSLGNTLLIVCQRPDATRCASYKTWQSMGRQVLKGERGIKINVPAPIKIEDPKTGDETRIMRFKIGTTFDVSQTEGDPLPELPREPIDGDSHEYAIGQLTMMAATIGFRVELRDLSDHRAGGWCDPRERVLVVDDSKPANAQVRTLVHELAHALGVDYEKYPRADAEVIVEAAAVVACGLIGLDTSGESVPYVAGWAQGDPGKVREYAGLIDSLAARISDSVTLPAARELVAA